MCRYSGMCFLLAVLRATNLTAAFLQCDFKSASTHSALPPTPQGKRISKQIKRSADIKARLEDNILGNVSARSEMMRRKTSQNGQ